MDFTWMKFVGPTFITEVPSTWLVASSNEFQTMFIAPPIPKYSNPYMMLVMRPLQDVAPLDDYIDAVQAKQQENYPDYQLISDETFRNEHDVTGQQVIFTWTNADVQQAVYQRQVFVSDDNLFYMWLATRPDEIDASLTQALDAIFERILSQFRFEVIKLPTGNEPS